MLTAGLDAVPLDVLERAAISNALERFGGNRTNAAISLGISVRTLQRKLKLWAARPEFAVRSHPIEFNHPCEQTLVLAPGNNAV
jgi:hypothetical protein